ncbi:hydrocephalus-inducing protein homolog [Manacus vitellinus]|uniref:hydrocephalus-inducing protein homolog n=1 Tax=Manacus vitellinus TaxID=328815 RepID=UPI00115F23B4|nr:hydrocephalus-inducing protein homolog [Manacus vitellinus]
MVIHNRTNITARFQWKAFSTEAEEHPQKIRLSLNLPRPPLETARLSVEKRYEELDLYDRELEKATAKIEADPMLFSDDVFTIEPLEGEVGPHSSAEIKVFFKPREAQVYTKVAYCSISGRESRLPLCLTGEGLGPCLRFKFPELDMGKVLVGEAYSYEAILVNTGAINAPFRLIPPTTVHGSCFTFQPRQGIIPRNGILPIQIFFSSSTLGEFEEEFQFNVAECPKPVTLIVRGHVTGLSLHFSTNGLDFNDVSFGFPQTLSCHLINTSVVPITFHLRVPEDGQGQPSLTSFDQVKYNTHPYWEKGTLAPCQEKPMEFTITPSTGTIPAHGFQEIRVTLCSNDVGQYDCDMVVDVDGFGKEVLALRLKARCVVPELCLLTSTLDCGPCSAKVPCQKMLTLVNPSPLPGCYRILPQRNQEAAALWYSSPKPCGIIQGHDVLEIPITAEVQAVGAHSIPVDIAVFGKERSPLGDRCLSIEPREGVVPAKAEVPVVVTANLDDTGRFEGSMKLFIENSLTSVIPIQAVGIGTTITIDKPFAPKLNLEPQFNLLPCILRFKVTNKGRQFQRLFWGTEGFSTFRQRHPLPALSVTKGKNASQSPTTPVFKLRPRNMDLQPGETMELVVEGFSSIVQDVEEKLVCEAIVKPEITKKEIIKTKVTCKFISPSMQISSRAITFHVEKYPDDVLTLQYKPLSLKNTCCLPFHLLMDLEQPFLICDANQQPLPAGAQPVKMEAGQELHLYISFNPAYEKDPISWAAKKTMKIRLVEHPYEEEITVQGEVYFPNLCIPTKALDFGCIVSGTEQVRYLEMTNCSPIPAHYHWSFQVDSKKYPTGFIPSPPTLKPQPQMARFGCVECGRYLRRYFRPGSVQKPAKAPEAAQDSSQQSAHCQETEQRCSQQTSKNCVQDSSEESSDWEDSLETEQDSSLQSSDSENCVETEDDSSEESSDSEDSLETEDISPEQSSSEKSLETKQDSCQKSLHSEDSPEAKVPPSTAAGPQSSAETEESVKSEEAKPPGFRAEELFNEVIKAEVTLQNDGKIEFTYVVQSPSTGTADKPLPGVLAVLPNTASIEPGKEQVLKLYYLPGMPGVFCRTFQIKINTWLRMEMDQMLIKEDALELQPTLISRPPEDTVFDNSVPQKLVKVELPEYILDMGTVVQGFSKICTVNITNTWKYPVAVRANGRALRDTGFSIYLEPVESLINGDTIPFQVKFSSANLPVGKVDVLLPIKVEKGPTLHIRLRAIVIQPLLSLSKDRLQFPDVQVGQCWCETVRLYNPFNAPCEWFLSASKPAKKVNKCSKPAVHQKELQAVKDDSQVFQWKAQEGTLYGREWCDLKIQFSPLEEKSYKTELKINVHGSSQLLVLHISGQGLEPRLEFSPTEIKLGAVLPCSPELERTVVVKNPCEFPIEFYSLDFDEEYREEEKILRTLEEFGDQAAVVMPPRAVGEKLPPEVLEYYEKWKKMEALGQEIMSKCKEESGEDNAALQESIELLKDMVDESDGPIRQAIRRYTRPVVEEIKAQMPRGIVIIVYGTPRTGKSRVAAALSKYYGVTRLSLAEVVTEAMSDERSSMTAISCATAPAPQRFIILTRTGRKEKIRKCLSCVLPKELLVEIISERLQLSDCYRGVVFDGLETLFASSLASSLLCILKAVSNRPHIHVVNIFQDSEFWKGRRMAAREKKAAKKQQKAREKEEAARRKEKRLWDVDVDEYEALTEKQKALLDYKIEKIKRERRERREQERLAREEEERKKALSKASKKQKKTKSPEVQQKSKKPAAKQQQQETKSADVRKGKTTAAKQQQQETKSADIRKGKTAAAKQQQQETKKPEVRKGKTAAAKQQQQETKIPEVPSKRDMILDLRFNIYESAQKEIRHILSSWDRVQGIMNKSQSSPKHKGEKSSSMSLERPEKKSLEEHGSHKSLQQEGEVRSHSTGVPCLDFRITRRENMFEKILKSKKLPPAKQILDSLGLGPLGPPILPGFLFSVVPYPEEDRVPAAAEDLRHFILVEPESAAAEDDVDGGVSGQVSPLSPFSLSPYAKAPEAEAEDHLKEEEDTSRCNSPQEKRNSPQSPKSLRDHSPETPRSSPESRKSKLQSDSTLERPTRLRKFRWIVPAHGEVELKIRFSTTMPGQFDQMMNFEILGSKRLYQLPCSATALYPSISQNPRLVFPRWRKNKEKEDIIVKEYKAQNCPDNSEKLTIFNDSPMEAEVHFSFENDSRGETFLLDPPSMRLQPKEKKKLTIWAYPTSTGLMQDSLICHVKDNAEPVVFRLCCEGVHVKLGVSPQELQFNKLLLHRTDTQTLVLRNDSPLPMAWHLSGLEDLGEDFSVSQGRGVVGPRKDLEVKLNFRAEKIGIINKMIRVEVSDTENILGIVHAETIKVSVEVYDVNLSINMPEGPDGSVDFGTINVFDNKKEVLSLKNKGLYDIEYNFKLTTGSSKKGDLKSHFTVRPQRAVLKASKPPVKVEILFHPMTEMLLKSRPILLCQVFDPQVGGETVATIPVRVSARAVYSKYSIEPASPIDFGTMIKGTKKTQVLTVENKGALNFKFFIHQAPPLQSSQEEESAPSVREKTHSTQAQLTVGMFTVSPCSGSIGPWGKQNITVDCNAGAEGKCEEQVYIDISNRDPKDNPLGIPFTLTAESCFPALVEDVTSIFEKYPIHSNINLHQTLQSVQGNGVFIRDDNTFIFTKVLVGQRATAYFKISNASSIPCNVVLSIKALPGEPHNLISHIFKLDPVEMKLPGLSHGFATVTFTPEEKKDHQCTFTASVVIPKSSSVNTKPQQLTFTISGEGHVPQVTVEYPGLRSKRGNPVLRFRRLLLGDSQALPLVLRNDGVIPTKFTVHIVDDKGVFFMKGRQSSLRAFHIGDMEEDSTGKAKKHPEKPYMLLEHGQSAEFDVFFKPTLAQHLEGKIRVPLSGNNEINIELVGEGYDDDFTFDNLPGLAEDSEKSNAEGSLEDDIIEAIRANHIEFGDCAVRELCEKTFTVTNRSKEVMRFEWLADALFQFSPKVGHLQPGCAKDIRVTLKSKVPVTIKRHSVNCKVDKIKYQLPPEEVYNWDDGMYTEKWEDTNERLPGARWPIKEKVAKAVPEPTHTVLEKSSREVELFLSAQVDYAKFKLDTVEVQLKQTEPFQTEISTFQMSNTGKVALKYSWEVDLEQERPSKRSGKPYSVTLMRYFLSSATVDHWFEHRPSRVHWASPLESTRPQSSLPHSTQPTPSRRRSSQMTCLTKHVSSSMELYPDDFDDPPLFSVEPDCGTIPAGQTQIFQVKFCPTRVGEFKAEMLCSIPNLKPSQKSPSVFVMGKGYLRKADLKRSTSLQKGETQSSKPKKKVQQSAKPE